MQQNSLLLKRLALIFCLLFSCTLAANDSTAAAEGPTMAVPVLLSAATTPPSFLRAASPLRAPQPVFFPLLVDDFNDNAMDAAKWALRPQGSGVAAVEQNQRLEVTPVANASGSNYNGYRSVAAYDLTGTRASVEVLQATGGTGGAETSLSIGDGSGGTGNSARFVVANGLLFCQYKVAGQTAFTTAAMPAYNAAQHRHWRLRHDAAADTLSWEVSGDGASWLTLASVARPFPVTALRVTLNAGTWYEQAAPGVAIFDNFLLEPNPANTPPSVSLTAPSAGATFTAPASFTLSAAATDADGGVSKVEFFSGTTLLGTVTSAPYNFTWNNVGAGSYSLTARATDSSGAQTTSAAVGVTVTLPTISVTATDASASEQGPDAATFTVARTGGTASALTVSYALSGTAANGTDYNTLSGTLVIPVGSSSQTVTVTPLDDVVVEPGGETVVLTLSNSAAYTVGSPSSATVAIADNDTYPPTASINSPAGGTVFSVPASIEIGVAASDADGTIAKVEFFQGATKLGEATAAPYSFTWVNPAAGSYSLTAKATDNAGATGTSAAVSVIVNTPPSVSVTGPADNTVVYAGTNVNITAAASDPDQGDSVAKVEFFQGATKLGEDTAAPYAFTWQNVPEGSYTLTAVTTDGRGATSTSAVVHVAAGDFAAARLDPANRTGAGGVDLYSRNFNWSLPLVNLPGRAGLDLGLSLSYNSLVWTKSGGGLLFDGDGGWPSPGFRLGFPVVQWKFYDTQAQKAAYLLVTPSGARVSLRQTAAPNVYEAGDSSYLQLTEEQDGSLTLVLLGGTRMTYRLHGAVYQCEKINDRNGNIISAAYEGDGRLDAVTDTLGRVVDFEYYPDGRLKEIKQTWHREVEGTAPATETHYWARFEYADVTLGVNFPGLVPADASNGQPFRALKKVKLADDSSFVFDYTSWGQVYQVKSYAPDERLLNYSRLNLPADASQPQSDCPRPTERRDWAAYANGDADGVPAASEELIISYGVTDGATWANPEDGQPQTGRLGQQTSPDGTVYREYAHTSGWDRGLARLSEYWSGGARKKWTSTAWTQDDEALPYPLNPRVRETNVYDSNEDGTPHSRRRTEVVYTAFGLPREVREYDKDASAVLRRTRTEYVPASVDANGPYTSSRLVGLLSKQEVFGTEGGQEKLFSKVTFEYDCGGAYLSAPEGSPASVAQHDDAHFGSAFNTRGLLCRTRRWDAEDTENLSKSVAAETGYNTLGSTVFTRDALGRQTTVSYADSDGGARFAYPTHVTDPGGFTSSVWYNYDMGVATRSETPKPGGANDQPVSTHFYDAAGRPLKAAAGPGGTYNRWEYGASGLYVKQLTQVDAGQPETFVMTVTNGAGAVVGVLREHPGDGTGYAASRTEYDPVNRVVRQYNPVEVSVDAADLSNARAWAPAGPDATPQGREGWPYSSTEYDWKGRVRREVNADGSDRLTDYEGCGCAGGEVVTMRGEVVPTHAPSPDPAQGRRTQRVYQDILGRPLKTEVLDWHGNVYSSTTTKYDALDHAVRVREYAGAAPSPADEPEGEGVGYQTATMTYDGHGRLKTRHLPAYDANTVLTYEYNADDTVYGVTDPRGVLTTFTYNSRRLVTRVAYDPQQSGVPDVPDVTFAYDAAGNRTAMTDEAGAVVYQYDALSRLASETRQFNGITHRTYTLTYSYNAGGQLKSMTDPFGGVTGYERDKAGQVTSVTGSGYPAIPQLAGGVQFASGIKYRAWGAVREASYGDGRGMTSDYDSRLRLTGFHMPGPLTLDKAYQYDADNGLRFADDLLDDAFDRSYAFDHAGRLAEAHTGEQARGGTTDDGPYQQTYTYDPFGHGAGQTNLLWKQVVGGGTVHYTNDRRQGWSYDAAGNLTYDQLRHYVNDAAGRMRSFNSGLQSYAYDGEGQVARVTRPLDGVTVYSLRSTALGGAVVSQLTPQSNAPDARQEIVYAGGAEVRRDVTATMDRVTWSHEDPAGTTVQEGGFTSFGGPDATFYNPVVQLDPVGASVGWADPAQFEEPPPPPDETSPEMPVYSNPRNPGGTGCVNAGLLMRCEDMLWAFGWQVNRGRTKVRRVDVRTLTIRGYVTTITFNGAVGDYEGDPVYSGHTHDLFLTTSHHRLEEMESFAEGATWGGALSPQTVQPQNPPNIESKKNPNCKIEVSFTGKYDEERPNGPGEWDYVGVPVHGLGFTVTVNVARGGIGRMGNSSLDNHGTWSVNQEAWYDTLTVKSINHMERTYPPFNDYEPFDLHKGVAYAVGGNRLTYYDHPGTPSESYAHPGVALISFSGRYNFRITATDGKNTCQVRFGFEMFYGEHNPWSVKWREGFVP